MRDTVPVLAIDGDLANGRKEGGDTFFLRILFEKGRGLATGYELVSGSPADLEKPDLHKYPSIYLLNVRELSDKALRNLEEYVRQGGSVAFFLGERVNPEFYNQEALRRRHRPVPRAAGGTALARTDQGRNPGADGHPP